MQASFSPPDMSHSKYKSPGMPHEDHHMGNKVPKKDIGKFKASLIIAKESWKLLKKDKEMIAFPILSSIISLVAISAIGAFFFLVMLGGDIASVESSSFVLDIVFAFIVYFVTTFITLFFEVGVIAIVRGRLAHGDLSFMDGMHAAISKLNKIFMWSLVSASVGTILKVISERSQWLGKLVVVALGATWSILTFFIAPILVSDDLSIKESMKRSAGTIRKVWGEAVLVNIGVGLLFALLIFVGFLVFLTTIFTGNITVIIVAAVLLAVYVVVLSVISSTLTIIFKVVLYEYANTGRVPQGFPEEVIHLAFRPKKKR